MQFVMYRSSRLDKLIKIFRASLISFIHCNIWRDVLGVGNIGYVRIHLVKIMKLAKAELEW
jgi:hypothetical protein